MDDEADTLVRLTAQERRVADLVGVGASNKAVARQLGVTIRTVEFHLGNTYRKLGIGTRSELAHLIGRQSTRSPSGSLLPPVPDLFDRRVEIEQIAASLSVHRLVTLRGPGGVGKTSLAVTAGQLLRDRYADGACFVDLSAASRPDEVVGVTCAALGLRLPVAATHPAVIADALASQQRLMILDNCEHVLEPARQIAEVVLRRCPHTVVLTTSRQRLDIVAEHVIAIGPLSVIATTDPSPAALLFIERARAVDAAFAPSPRELEHVESICRRLDGLPLAIELAATRAFAFGTAELERRLGGEFDVLARHDPGVYRHASLRTTIEWSYRLLSADEQRTLATLSVFADDFDLDAAVAVANPNRAADAVADDIAGLVEASLINVVGQRRMRLLETLRAFATERLEEHGMTRETANRHMQHFATQAHTFNEQLRGADELNGHIGFTQTWPDMRRAIATAIELDDGPTACALINNILVWAVTRTRADVGPWCTAIMAMPSVTDLPAKIPVIAGAMYYANLAGDAKRAASLLEFGRSEEDRLGRFGEPILPAFAVFLRDHDMPVADSMHRCIGFGLEVQERARRTGSAYWLVLGSTAEAGHLGALMRTGSANQDDKAHIVTRTAEVMDLAARLGNPYLRSSGEMYHALAIDKIDPDRATRLLTTSLADSRRLQISLLTSEGQIGLAVIHTRAGRPLAALAGLRRAMIEHLRAGAITDVLADLATCVRPLLAISDRSRADTVILDIRITHPATYNDYGLATLDNSPTRNPLIPPDITRTATNIIEHIADLLQQNVADQDA